MNAKKQGREGELRALVERQRAELADRDRRLAALTDTLPGGVVCCDTSPELNLIEYSDGFLKLFGYSREEIHTLFQDRFSKLIVAEDLEACWPLVRQQLSRGNTKQIEYRIRRKNGQLIWVLDRGQLVRREDGSEYFHCILIDETETKLAYEALQESLERYRIIMDQANDIIFEWDLDTDTVEVSGNWEKKFGYPPTAKILASDWLEETVHIHRDDREALRRLVRQIRDGQPYGEAEARVADAGGRFLWCKIRLTLQKSERRAVGVVIDIDDQRRQTQRLQMLAERDTLTGLYNKGTARALIEAAMAAASPGELAGLMILDVDDFKLVNDRYGHLGGDAVLSDLAKAVQGLFRSGDVIGRIGGDEFCVYLRGIRDRGILERKAQDILALFQDVLRQERSSGFSGSLGIALFPEDGEDYNTLFQNADVALYHAKEKGKDQFAFYEAGMDWPELRSELAAVRSAGRDKIESEGPRSFLDGDLAGYVFRVLYQSSDVEQAIDLLLEIVGRKFDVSRMYIYELEEGGRYVSNTFEWCNEGITPEIGTLQHVPTGEIWDMLGPLKEQGVLYCRDVAQLSESSRAILERQGILSTLQCAIYDGTEFRGAVGFDECRILRLWNQEQVDALTFIADIVSTFLMKQRAQERTEDLMESLRSILDHQPFFLYVVDPETHNVLYANKMTKEVLPGLEEGVPCHRLFYHSEEPCEDCPIRRMGEAGEAVGRLYSWVLDLDVDVRVNTIPWLGGRKAYLLSCSRTEGKGGRPE